VTALHAGMHIRSLARSGQYGYWLETWPHKYLFDGKYKGFFEPPLRYDSKLEVLAIVANQE
jgi:hypothetical protein